MKRKLIFCILLSLCLYGTAVAQTITLSQIWDDAGNLDGSRPEVLPVTVTVEEETRTLVNGESAEFPDGDVFFSHDEIPEGYSLSYVNADAATFIYKHIPGFHTSVTNTIEDNTATTTFSVTKRWQGEAQDSITLHLYADGEEIPELFQRVDGKNGGTTYFVPDLPMYRADGGEIVYSAKEEYMEGYLTMYLNVGQYRKYSKSVYNGGTIVNRQVRRFRVKKVWIGVAEENRPEITFQLYQNGEAFDWKQPRYENGWYIWENLPVMKDGKVAEYYVKENEIAGYEVIYEDGDAAWNGETIKNYRVPETGDDSDIPAVLPIMHYEPGSGTESGIISELKAQSPYIVGWLNIPEQVDEAVAQLDHEFFLDHDAYGNSSRAGAIFMDSLCTLDSRPYTILLYGHNMRTGDKFGRLKRYAEPGYYIDHSIITFVTERDSAQYDVVAAGTVSLDKNARNYVNFYNLTSRDTAIRQKEIAALMNASVIDSIAGGIQADDQLLILVTCEGEDRWVVCAKMREK